MSDKVSDWLDGLGLGQYAAKFMDNAIDWEILPEVDQDALKDIGVDALGHRLRILKAIAVLQPQHSAPPSLPANQVRNEPPPLSDNEDITAWSRTPGERKPVTMLFADIVGSTALTEKLDAEDAHDLLYRATQYMCRAVENNNGTVCRFMGDGIMAMFGAPVSSERHALEACRAATDMQASVAQYAAEVQNDNSTALQIRIGLNSGEVVVLEVGDDPENPEYDASGPTVPLAARMEQTAAAGTILMTEATRVQAGNLIDAVEQPAVSVKGVSEPVTVFRLNDIHSATEAEVKFNRQPMVGRVSELAQFSGLMEACLQSGHGQTVVVRGEAGIGKTRLVEEMTAVSQKRGFTSHKALVFDFGAGKGQEAIPALVRSLLGITQGSGKTERGMALSQAEANGIADRENRIFLNDLLDLEQPLELRTLYDAMDQQARKAGKRDTLADILAKLAEDRSVLVVVEDLHWADAITLDYLAVLASTVAECSALMVLTTRSEGDRLDVSWRASAGDTPIVTWDLSPLRDDESSKLASGFVNANDSLTRRCIERAAGNPLFLEQLLLNVEKGVVDSVPDSIKSLVLSRMDQLSGEDKQALQAASVLGQRFQDDSLRYLIGQPDYDCLNLVNRQLVRPDGSLYLFAHALIREGAYTSLLKRQRSDLHRRAAEWYGERDSVLHAEHLDQAGDSGAADAYLAAAREQLKLYRPERALKLTRRGLEIAVDSQRFELLCLDAELLRHMGSVIESIDVFRSANDIAENDTERCRALVGLAEGLVLVESHDELLKVLTDAEGFAKSHDLWLEMAIINQLRGGVYFFRSEYESCLEASSFSLQCARKAGSPEIEARALSGLGDAEYTRGRYISAKHYFNQCIEIAQQNGYGRIIAANLMMRGYVSWYDNQIESALVDCREAIDLAVKTHHARAEMIVSLIYVYVSIENGDLIECEKLTRRAESISSRIGSRMFEGECLIMLGRIEFLRGKDAEALKLVLKALDLYRATESGMSFWGPVSLGYLAMFTNDPVQRREALAEAEALLNAGCVSHNHFLFYDLAMEISLQLGAWNEVDRYAEALQAYSQAEPLGRIDFLVARGCALANHGRGNRDKETTDELQRLYVDAEKNGLKLALPALKTALMSS